MYCRYYWAHGILYHQKIDLNLKHIAYERCIVEFWGRLVKPLLFANVVCLEQERGLVVQRSR
jgi:hypothetical protein